MNDLVERARLPGTGTRKFQQELADEIERLQDKVRRLLDLSQNNAHSWDAIVKVRNDLQADNERLRAALKRVAAEANGGRNSANDDELRDWLWGIEDVARAALEPKP